MSLQVAKSTLSIEDVGPNGQERAMLDRMHFVAPYLGLVVVGPPDLGTIGLWLSGPDRYRELRILSTTITPNCDLQFDSGWSYGTIGADELVAVADPLQATIDASYHTENRSGPRTNFSNILQGLHDSTQGTKK